MFGGDSLAIQKGFDSSSLSHCSPKDSKQLPYIHGTQWHAVACSGMQWHAVRMAKNIHH